MAEFSKAIARLMADRERERGDRDADTPEAAEVPTPSRTAAIESAPTPPSVDLPKLREVLAQVRAKFAAGERPLADALVRQLFDKAGADWWTEADISELVGGALAAFRFVSQRLVGEPRVAVFDPDLIPQGWGTPCSVLQTLMRDRPFIVDTIRECLRQADCTVRRLVHPIFTIERDARGTLLAIAPPGAPGHRESFVHVELDRVPDPDELTTLVTRRLNDLILVTEDYQAMRTKVRELADEIRSRPLPRPWNADTDELAAFLGWLGQKSFVFLGYREYRLTGQGAERTATARRGSGLGILRKEDRSNFATPRSLPEALRRRLNEPPLQIVSKTNSESPVHRHAHMDYIGIKEIDAAGMVLGERRLLGLFTSKAYAEESTAVPLLRRKLAAILEAEGAIEESHDYKAITEVFNSMPLVELLATPVNELRAEIRTIVAVEGAGGTGAADVHVLQRSDGRGLFIVVMVPRARFSEELYRRTQLRLVEVLAASAVLEQRLVIDDQSDQVRMHFYLGTPALRGDASTISNEDLRRHVSALLRTWDDRLREALREQVPREAVRALADRYTAALPDKYKASTDVAAAVRDIRCLEALVATRAPQVDVANDVLDAGQARFTAVKLYLAGEGLVLSDFLPVLENLGLKVFTEDALEITLPDVGGIRLHTFFVQDAAGARLPVDTVAVTLKPALLMLYAGRVENDRLNALILTAGLDWRSVDVLRTYVNHGVQIGTAASREAIVHAVVSHPAPARLLWEYFDAKFDPLKPEAPRERLARTLPEIEQRFIASLDTVQEVSDDRILRALFGSVAGTVRTNFFCAPTDTARRNAPDTIHPAALAVKLDWSTVQRPSAAWPAFEIYVHAAPMEGVHLRSSHVARGGIRWSDRPDDFRTEILDLMKTQTVKNAVIVPGGAKGGFVVKRRGNVPASAPQVSNAYRTMIGALLDVTDNLVQGRVTPPSGVLIYDGPDPYLVVAADKGTATFSDVANEIAAQRQLWLGDAFASGGAHGYDHKKEGITTRGAWECARRHFREMGRDVDRETLNVIGIGDMSGDVFGNGLLLSRRFRLRAAFNHQHIFLDPDPDLARSFAERERLFHLPRSSWADYNGSIVSPGGGVYSRHAKKVPLSAAARQMLGVDVENLSGDEVVRAILRMEADLLWNGGVGTFVKASDESHHAVGDSANDGVRVNGVELRAAVVAEGGNLGFTQRGRIEYALRGGRINTDAIDNSAGVDMSDHEVNLKIALAPAIRAGQLAIGERNQLLTELEPEVMSRVLAHNRRQARILSLDQHRSQTRLTDFRDLMTQLESDGRLDRQLESLPTRETLRDRRGAFRGLTRPELAVLLAHSKLALQHQVLGSTVPDDPFFERHLRNYFPDAITSRFGQAVRSHQLRREIIAVEIANSLIDTMGATFVTRISRDTGADPAAVVRAWDVVVMVCGVTDVFGEVVGLDPPLPLAAEERCWLALEGALERATKWMVETQPAEGSAAELSAVLTAPVQELLTQLPQFLPAAAQAHLLARAEVLASEGTPRLLAQRILALDRLAELFEIAHIAADLGVSRGVVADIYYRIGEIVDLDWVQQGLAELPGEGRWDRRAGESLHLGFVYARRQLTRNVLLGHEQIDVDTCMREYIGAHGAHLAKLRSVIDDVKSGPCATLASLVVVMRELDRLGGGVP